MQPKLAGRAHKRRCYSILIFIHRGRGKGVFLPDLGTGCGHLRRTEHGPPHFQTENSAFTDRNLRIYEWELPCFFCRNLRTFLRGLPCPQVKSSAFTHKNPPYFFTGTSVHSGGIFHTSMRTISCSHTESSLFQSGFPGTFAPCSLTL